MTQTSSPSNTSPTDAELLAALQVGIAAGDFVEVTDEWLKEQTAELAAPVVTWSEPDAWAVRRYFVDGLPVATVRETEATRWQCAPGHRHEWRGVTGIPVGEHVEGCGRVPVTVEYAVYLEGYNGGPRYYPTTAAAYAEAGRLVESARRCSLPVRARLCRLLKRHDGPCVPWA